nr:hypothetical protein HK105_005790 [Polyrhizophydium stewartii]
MSAPLHHSPLPAHRPLSRASSAASSSGASSSVLRTAASPASHPTTPFLSDDESADRLAPLASDPIAGPMQSLFAARLLDPDADDSNASLASLLSTRGVLGAADDQPARDHRSFGHDTRDDLYARDEHGGPHGPDGSTFGAGDLGLDAPHVARVTALPSPVPAPAHIRGRSAPQPAAAASVSNGFFAIDPESRSFYIDNLWESHRHVFASHARQSHHLAGTFDAPPPPGAVGAAAGAVTGAGLAAGPADPAAFESQLAAFPSLPTRRPSTSSALSVDAALDFAPRRSGEPQRPSFRQASFEGPLRYDTFRHPAARPNAEAPDHDGQHSKGIFGMIIPGRPPIFPPPSKTGPSTRYTVARANSVSGAIPPLPLAQRPPPLTITTAIQPVSVPRSPAAYTSDSAAESFDSQATPRPMSAKPLGHHYQQAFPRTHRRQISDPTASTHFIPEPSFPFRHDTNFTKDDLAEDAAATAAPQASNGSSVTDFAWRASSARGHRPAQLSSSYGTSHMEAGGYSPPRSAHSDVGFLSHTALHLPPHARRANTTVGSSGHQHATPLQHDGTGLSSFPNYDSVSARAPASDFIFGGARHDQALSLGAGAVPSAFDVDLAFTVPEEKNIPLQYYRNGIFVFVGTPLVPSTLNSIERLLSKFTVYPVSVRLLKPNVKGLGNPRPIVYTLYKRYRDFRALYSQLAREYQSAQERLPEFPSKVFLDRYNPQVVAFRLVMFNQLLSRVVLDDEYAKSEALQRFLRHPSTAIAV